MAGTPTPSLILHECVEGTGGGGAWERVGTGRMDRVAVAPGGCGDKRGRKFLPQFPTPKGEVTAQPGVGATRRLGCYRPTPGGLEARRLTPPRPRSRWGACTCIRGLPLRHGSMESLCRPGRGGQRWF